MTYSTHSTHAPTGADAGAKKVVSPNEYAPEGRAIGYPSRLDLYVIKISDLDGSTQVGEGHTEDQLFGNRLYLYHRPMVDPTGGVATVTSTDGTILQVNTNAKQGYIEYSSSDLPAGDFTVSYLAAPDCFNHWQQNKMQDSIMELESKVGPSNQTGWTSLRNVKAALFDKPTSTLNLLLPNLYSLPHLGNDIRISSSDDSTLTGTLGDQHIIQVGRSKDSINLQGTGITLGSADGFSPNLYSQIVIGTRTGDQTIYQGTLSGFDQMTLGGAGSTVAGYSGVQFTADLTGSYYSGAMLRVHGDVAAMGNIKAIGTLTLISTTGETSTVLGDFTIRDELFVYGVSHLIGPTITNSLTTNQDHTLKGNLVAGNTAGAGENGHTLVDNLDPSEVAATYAAVTKKHISNAIISAPSAKIAVDPKRTIYGGDYSLSGARLVGDVFQTTGFFTQAASFSGAHPSILQLQWNSGALPVISGFYTGGNNGLQDGGYFSKGWIDPGSLWVEVLDGTALGYKAPIYGYTVEETQGDYLTKLNVFTPEVPSKPIAAFDKFMLYTPGCEHFSYVSADGGSSPTATVSAIGGPLWIGFEDEVRVLPTNSTSANMVIGDVLLDSTSGTALPHTGIAYVLASRNNVDIEDDPAFVVRPTPFHMPGETVVGEVVAESADDVTWTILETTSYRPGGKYDSSWIPFSPSAGTVSGRVISKLNDVASDPASISGNRFYFNHNLGADLHFSDVNVDLYLASYGGSASTTVHPNAYRAFVHSLWGADSRHDNLAGSMTKMSLDNLDPNADNSEASVFYMDGKVIGIQLHDYITGSPRGTTNDLEYIRLVVQRTS